MAVALSTVAEAMLMDPALTAQIKPYEPWLLISGVFVLFILLRLTCRALRHRVDRIGYRLFGERGLLIWFWMNAPGVILHELCHACVVLLFRPFGFRITKITLFRIKPLVQGRPYGMLQRGMPQALQLGEVQYVRPPGRLVSHIGDGLSAVAPLIGGIGAIIFLYWVATGYNIWEVRLQLIRPGWPWWTLLFAPYLILTITAELWPSSQDWRGARWLLTGLLLLAGIALAVLWYTHLLVFNEALLQGVASVALHIDFALLALLILDLAIFIVADLLNRLL
ncbi:MAG: hypothetical protein IRZ31_12870 [Thermogemmatispora sp.]|uniref:hypothetical protein n=1 Tax=Thermogemmatispora sp. TaxID=1968838 RepID=UPI0026303B5F|nr:hypothetical protein [Thermogemmatispora sp.]MBX5457786.1 hypothetical protein [Thermogemmatispora sp.]